MRTPPSSSSTHSLFNAHPRFFGYITASPAPIGILGDFLAAASTRTSARWMLSPAASEIEAQTVRWIAELIGYPPDCGGLMVSGGNMANLVCFLAARAAAAPWDVRAARASRRRPAPRACTLRRRPTRGSRRPPTSRARHRRDPLDPGRRRSAHGRRRAATRAIAEDVAAGDLPLLVVGTAGSVSTGAVDPLPEIAAICREHGVWFHVDGAYGGFAARVPGAPASLRALAEADSVAVDPHKWLYAPLEAGCALVRDAGRLRAAFAYHPPYYHFDERATNYVDFGPQNSRGFRALKVWLALRQVGASGYRAMIARRHPAGAAPWPARRPAPGARAVTQA